MMISRKQAQHAVAAYILLAAFGCLVWISLLSPITDSIAAHKQRTNSLTSMLEMKADDHAARIEFGNSLSAVIRAAIEQGAISAAFSGSQAEHELQQSIKVVFADAGANIVNLSPSSDSQAAAPSNARLDISFRISGRRLDALLATLSALRPKLQVELLSARRLQWRTQEGTEFDLDVNAVLSVPYLSKAFRAQLTEMGVDPSVFVAQVPRAPEPSTAPTLKARAYVAGLFDAKLRQRVQNPSADEYRLSAISMSANSRTAIITEAGTELSHRVKEGDVLHAWTVQIIDASSVTLVSGTQEAKLKL